MLLGALLALLSWSASADEINGVAKVIDGDTLEVWEITVRLEGIDAPEIAQTCTRASGTSWACGEAAADHLKRTIDGKALACRGDEKDRYDRLIATCFLDGQDLNRSLVLNGWAVAFVQFSDTYVAEEQQAKTARRGLWAGTFTRPVAYRAARFEEEKGSSRTTTASDRCVIKGNINGKGVRIYHTPWGSRHYDRTRIDTSRGERWFCSEAEAVAAGWRAPYR